MRPETAALVIHDLKNALGALEAELGLLAAEAGSGERAGPGNETGHDGARARRSHRQCSELRQRFVQFLAVYAAGEQMQAHCNDESPADLLAMLVETHSDHPGGIALNVVREADIPAFWYFDRRLVRMALDAALHNALRFAHARIEISARSAEGYLVFSVDDDGPGLGATDPSEDSTGLGTALCTSVAQAHSSAARTGRVSLANRPQGGARFELWLA